MTPVDDFLRLLGLSARRDATWRDETNRKKYRERERGENRGKKAKRWSDAGVLGAPIKKGSRGCRAACPGTLVPGKVRGEASCRKLPRQGAACRRESSASLTRNEPQARCRNLLALRGFESQISPYLRFSPSLQASPKLTLAIT